MAKQAISKSNKIVFFTGAGMSQESGLSTFRGRDGYWRKYDPMKLASPEAFRQDPKLVWDWYYDRRRAALQAKPNAGHVAIALLQNLKQVSVITQNVDDLHRAAGSRNIVELYGNLFKVRCTSCKYRGRIDDKFPPPPPKCEKCDSLLRPDIVWFGEELPKDSLEESARLCTDCDLMVIVGSSLQVAPANSLPVMAKRNGATLVEINVEATHMSEMMDYSIIGTAAGTLPALLDCS
ncbi:MAG: NAD-dependent protein deacylase [Nitrososphaera sp.]|nr:NAD-dependent protein deacylase [Nitrososphaera sp.]